MTLLTDDLVEKAARALYDSVFEPGFEELDPCGIEYAAALQQARAALTAVLPDIIEECAKVADDEERRLSPIKDWNGRLLGAARPSAPAAIRALLEPNPK